MPKTRRNRGVHPTKTAAFKKWFGKSKIVDDKGNPTVMYRGFRKVPKPTDFKTVHGRATLTFCADPQIASVYARTIEQSMVLSRARYKSGANVGAYYLRILRPLDLTTLDDTATLWDIIGDIGWDFSMHPKNTDKVFTVHDILTLLYELEKLQKHVDFTWESRATLPGNMYQMTNIGDVFNGILEYYREGGFETEQDFWGAAEDMDYLLEEIEVDVYAVCDTSIFTKKAKANRYDGIIHWDTIAAGAEYIDDPSKIKIFSDDLDEWVFPVVRPFKMNQIKSIFNKGKWSLRAKSVLNPRSRR